MSTVIHEEDYPLASCPGCGTSLVAHVLVEVDAETRLQSLSPLQVKVDQTAAQITGLELSHACGALVAELPVSEAVDRALARPRICLCTHIEAIHVAEGEFQDAPCTARSCDCTGFIGRNE